MLSVLDEYSREALCVAVKPRMGNAEVLEALYPLFLKHGRPEFIAENFQTWLTRVGIKPIRIYPGSPWENGYNARFNGTLRREVLNAEWFTSIRQAQVVIETWLKQYNHIRPHQALNMRPPVPETLSGSGTSNWGFTFRTAVGFDRLTRMLDSAAQYSDGDLSYPPYNIEQADDDHYRVTMAVAGFKPADIEVVLTENTLTIKSNREAEDKAI